MPFDGTNFNRQYSFDIQNLIATRDAIANRGWRQNGYGEGRERCLLGWMHYFYGNMHTGELVARLYIGPMLRYYQNRNEDTCAAIARFNDTSTKEEVLYILDRAIANAIAAEDKAHLVLKTA
jgi:hypothetical protein